MPRSADVESNHVTNSRDPRRFRSAAADLDLRLVGDLTDGDLNVAADRAEVADLDRELAHRSELKRTR